MLKTHRLYEDYQRDDGSVDYRAMANDLAPPLCDVMDPTPSTAQLEQWLDEGGCEAVGCGCWVEADGVCKCGNESWLLRLGMI